MDDTTDIVALYAKLPPEIKRVLSSIELSEAIGQLAQTHKLHIDQEGFLWDSVKRVMVGLTKASAFTNEIKEGLKISDAEAVAITKDAQHKIFLPIRELLKEVGGETFTETAPENVPTFNANAVVENPERERAAVLNAITNPSSLPSGPTSYIAPVAPKAPETPTAAPTAQESTPVPTKVATTQAPAPTPPKAPDNLVAAKLSGTVSIPGQETQTKSIPSRGGDSYFSDLKSKINSDPYKEPI